MSRKPNPKQQEEPTYDLTEIKGLLAIAAAFILFLSLISFAYGYAKLNILGLVGYSIGWVFHACFGLGSYLICPFLFWLGGRLLFRKSINHKNLKLFYFSLLLTSTCLLLSLAEDQYPAVKSAISHTFYTRQWHQKMNYHLGGAPFFYLYRDLPSYNLHRLLNATGVAIIFLSTFIASILFFAKIKPAAVFHYMRGLFQGSDEEEGDQSLLRLVKLYMPAKNTNQEFIEIQPEAELKTRPSISKKMISDPLTRPPQEAERPKSDEVEKKFLPGPEKKIAVKKEPPQPPPRIYSGDFAKFRLPPPSLITPPQKVDTSQLKKNLKRQAEVLEETLCSFGIEAKVGQINCGPTITSFEVHPAIGVKVQKIKALENDIALNMEAKSIRIIAPIPGKAAVGIEVPNSTPQEVGFRDLLTAYNSRRGNSISLSFLAKRSTANL